MKHGEEILQMFNEGDSFIAIEGLACDHHVSYDGQRWANIWHGYPNDDEPSHPAAQYKKARFPTKAGQPKV